MRFECFFVAPLDRTGGLPWAALLKVPLQKLVHQLPGPAGAAPVRGRSHSSAGLRANKGRLWPLRRRPPPHTAPGWGERRGGRRLASLNAPATAASAARAFSLPFGRRHRNSSHTVRTSSFRLKLEHARAISRLSVTAGTLNARPENLVVATVIAKPSAFPRHRTKTPRECPGGRRKDRSAQAPRPSGPGWLPERGRVGAVPAQIDPKGMVPRA